MADHRHVLRLARLAHEKRPLLYGYSGYNGSDGMNHGGAVQDMTPEDYADGGVVEGDDRTGYKDGGKIKSSGEWEEARTPQQTVKAFKMFRRLKNGKIYPLFVHRTREIPLNKWLAAEAGEQGEKGGVQSSLGELAFRPGWHSSTLPRAVHIGGISTKKKSDKVDYRPYQHVWAEVEHPADVDWQSVADSRARVMNNGMPDKSTAHITDQVPHDGTYNYTTNPNNPDSWMISGGMKVNRLLSDDEVKGLNAQAGVADLPRLHEMNPNALHPSLRNEAATQGMGTPRKKRDAGGALDLSGYQDAPAPKLQGMPWRPLQDVHADLGGMREIPSHVQAFGRFMDETSNKAATKGLTPRDLIKAYAITRASIGRGAVNADTIRREGFEIPHVKGKIRPEGAMGEWLHSPMGQEYLRHAERGIVHAPSIEHAMAVMKPFGKASATEGHALKWAAQNLPGAEGHVSKMIAAARHAKANPQEWRDFIKGVPGVATSKAGFIGSMLGRGDQPTLDARQIILHTGRPTSEAAKPLSRVGGAEQAVDRLASRQKAMNLSLPEELRPYYQHLAHHAVWDKAANEQTTHEDLMNAMRHAARGGRIGRGPGGSLLTTGYAGSPLAEHEVAHALHGMFGQAGGLSGLWQSPSDQNVRDVLRSTPDFTSADPAQVAKALALQKQAYSIHPTFGGEQGQSYSGFKGGTRPYTEEHGTVEDIPGATPKPINQMDWDEFIRKNKGAHLINLGGDRSRLGRITHVNGKKLAWDVDAHAGPDYMREPNRGAVWANAPGASSRITNVIRDLRDKGDVFGIYAPMGPKSVDSSKHMTDLLMAQIGASPLAKEHAKEFDEMIKSGLFMPVGKGKKAAEEQKARDAVVKKMREKKWVGVSNAKAARDQLLAHLTGAERSLLMKHLDKAGWVAKGVPHIGHTRLALTDPAMRGIAGNMYGPRIVRLSDMSPEKLAFIHNTYPETTGGEYVGDVEPIMRHFATPDVTRQNVNQPPASGLFLHPLSENPHARSGYKKNTEEQKVAQPLNEEMAHSIGHGLEVQRELRKHGYRRGGVIANALRLARDLGGETSERQLSPSGLYSHAAEAAAALPQQKGTMQQFGAMLGKAGVKPAELQNSGFDFTSPLVAKREYLARHFAAKMPKLHETELWSHTSTRAGKGMEYDAADKPTWQHRGFPMPGNGPAQYEQYTVPGGHNYRELLLHAPTKPGADESEKFQSNHWQGLPNVVTHLRMSERNLPKEKYFDPSIGAWSEKSGKPETALHLEEVQSDWRNALREHHKTPTRTPEQTQELQDNMRRQEAHYERKDGAIMPPEELEKTIARYNELLSMRHPDEPAPPSHPYVEGANTALDLGLKRALIEAARGGHSKLLWTPDEEQQKRYPGGREDSTLYNKVVPARLTEILKKISHKPVFGRHSVEYDDIDPDNEWGAIPERRSSSLHSLDLPPELREKLKKGLPAFERGGEIERCGGGKVDQALRITAKPAKAYANSVFGRR